MYFYNVSCFNNTLEKTKNDIELECLVNKPATPLPVLRYLYIAPSRKFTSLQMKDE